MRIADKSDRNIAPQVLAALLVVSILLTTAWFREDGSGPLHSVRAGASVVTAPISAAGRWVFTPVRAVGRFVSNLNVDRSELETLRNQNIELRARVMQLEEANLEAERLRDLVDLKDAMDLDSVGAKVISASTDNWSRTIGLDKGTTDGIEVGMPVVNAQGLLGQVIEVGPYSSVVRLLTDDRSGVAAMIQSNRARGIVSGNVNDQVSLDFIGKEIEVVPGDVVITSGLGGVFPKGLIIGEVLRIDRGSSDIFRSIILTLAADVRSTEEVLVITGAVVEEVEE